MIKSLSFNVKRISLVITVSHTRHESLEWKDHPGYPPVILTNHGGWYYHSNDFLTEVTHSGDKAESYNIEAERFYHYSLHF